MLMKELLAQLNTVQWVSVVSIVSLVLCSGCTRQEPAVASSIEHVSSDTHPQTNDELIFNVQRARIKKSQHCHIGQMRFGIQLATDQNRNKFQGIPQDLQNVEILEWKFSNRARGTVYGLRGMNTSGEKFFAIDTDNDYRFDDETIQSSDATTAQKVMYIADDLSESAMTIEIFPGTMKDEYAFREFWNATIQVGQETLPVGIAYVGIDKHLMFCDADQDGSYETFVAAEQELALGGSFWKIDVDLAKRQIRLSPGTGKSMTVGAIASEFELDANVDTGKPTIFVFCKCMCGGCAIAMPKIEKMWRVQQQKGLVNIVNIATDQKEKEMFLSRYNITFPQTVQPELWRHFGVTPTPTIVLIDENQVVRFRGGDVSEELKKLVASYSR